MAGLISTATREQIRAANDIVEVISSYLPLKRAGANYVALCPFHKEKTPSFNVNPRLQIFHCFGCHKGGDVFTFVKEYENIGFMDAVRRLAERAKIPLEFEKDTGQAQTRHLKEKLLEIHEQITRRWQNALANEAAGEIARNYLAQRKVPPEAVKLFRLGYAPDAWDDTVNWARSKGYDLDLVEKAGLIIRREAQDARPEIENRKSKIENFYDRFRGRLMFPICDELGRVVGFSGRILAGDEKTAKYVNSPETPIFTKSKVFYGLDKSKRAILERGFAIVCEGQLDLIACYMAGVTNVVAPQGTALTADHARILKRYVDEVVLCFDSDEAGQSAAVRSLDNLLASGLTIRVALIPAPHDPDSFIKEFGGAAFQELIQKAEGFFDYYLNRLCRLNDITTDKGRLAIVRGMGEVAAKTANAVVTETLAQKTASRLGLAPGAVLAEFNRPAAQRQRPATPADEDQPPPPSQEERPSNTEQWLLRLVLLNNDVAHWLAEHLDLNWIQHARVRQIVAARLQCLAEENWHGLAAFLADCDDDALRELVTEATTLDRAIPDPARQLRDVVLTLRNQFIDRQMLALRQQINSPEVSEPEKLEAMRRYQELIRAKLRPLEPRDVQLPVSQG